MIHDWVTWAGYARKFLEGPTGNKKVGLVVNKEKMKCIWEWPNNTETDNIKFESVRVFKYLGSIVSSNNSGTEEIGKSLQEEDTVMISKNFLVVPTGIIS